MPQVPITPFVAGALLLASLLPVRLAPRSLGWLPFGLWLLGGVVLLSLGAARLAQAARGETTPVVVAVVALARPRGGHGEGLVRSLNTSRRVRTGVLRSTAG
jgi:hypothetical protein